MIPELNVKTYPEYVKDWIDVTYCNCLCDLIQEYSEAVNLNQQKDYTPMFNVDLDYPGWAEDPTAAATFSYMRKPNKEDLEIIDSYNYRVIQNYNNFIKQNPDIAKLRGLKLQGHETSNK